MAKASKATKKFQNKHLKHTLDHRKEVQKHKKKVALRKKSKGPSEENAQPKEKKATKAVFDDMSVEDFFEGGFEVPKPKKGTVAAEESEDDEEEGNSDESASEDEDQEENDIDEDAESSEEEDVEQMQKDLEALEGKDPEFYNYLKNNDKDLLDFEAVNPLDAISDDEDDAEDEEDEGDESVLDATAKKTKLKQEITKSLVANWNKQLKKPTIKLLQNIVSAFKTAIYITRADENDTKYTISDPSVFSDLMFVGLQRIPEAIQILSPYKVNLKGIRSVDDKNANARKVTRILKSQAGAYITLLQDITNTETAALVLASLQEVIPFYISQRKILKEIFSSVVDVWAMTSQVETQIATYAFLNNVAREYPKSTLEIILKQTYSTFLKNCRKTNPHTLDLINFSKNSAAELFGIDEQLSYQVGFEYVRQLAIHLRNTITNTSNSSETLGKDAYRSIYNWQFCHSLDFWSRVLADHCNPEKELVNHKNQESPLRSLIYPLVQVTLGTMRLIPTPQFFPLRFYLIRSLIRLSQGTGVYIPIYPLISEILTSTAFTKPGKNVKLEGVDFDYIIKMNQQYLGTKAYQDGLCEQFLELTSEFFVLYSKSVAFPELATPAVLSLRRFMKKSKNIRFNKQLQQLVEKLNATAAYITTKRSNIEYGPSNKAEVKNFLKDVSWESTPLGQYVVVQRKAKEERVKLLKEAIAEEERAKNSSKDADVDDFIGDEQDEQDDEDDDMEDDE